MKYPHRCRRCRTRVVLARIITDYVYKPTCKTCGFRLYFERARYLERKNRKLCYCRGLDFGESGHRPGSSVWCQQHPTGPTDADYYNRHGDLYDEGTLSDGVDDPPF